MAQAANIDQPVGNIDQPSANFPLLVAYTILLGAQLLPIRHPYPCRWVKQSLLTQRQSQHSVQPNGALTFAFTLQPNLSTPCTIHVIGLGL